MKRTLRLSHSAPFPSIHPERYSIRSETRARDFKNNCIITSTALVIPRTKRRPAVSIQSVTRAPSTRPFGPNPEKIGDVDVTEGTHTSHLHATHTMSHASTLTRVQTTSTVRTRRGSSARRGASVIRASGVYGASLVHSFIHSFIHSLARAFETRWRCVHDDRKPSGLLGRVELVVTLLFAGGD